MAGNMPATVSASSSRPRNSAFAHKVTVRSYPVREYLGLIFAYLGDGDTPEFPRHPEFERFAA